jgi:hypothetical protein
MIKGEKSEMKWRLVIDRGCEEQELEEKKGH